MHIKKWSPLKMKACNALKNRIHAKIWKHIKNIRKRHIRKAKAHEENVGT